MFTPCSLNSRLTGSLRISPDLPAPLLPFPPAHNTYFPRVFRLLLQWCWGPAKRQLWEAGPPMLKPNKWEKENRGGGECPSTRRQAPTPFPFRNLGALSSFSWKLQEGIVLTWHSGLHRRELLPILFSASQTALCAHYQGIKFPNPVLLQGRIAPNPLANRFCSVRKVSCLSLRHYYPRKVSFVPGFCCSHVVLTPIAQAHQLSARLSTKITARLCSRSWQATYAGRAVLQARHTHPL